MFLGFVVFVAIVGAALWFVTTYNQLAAARQRIGKAWSDIDVLLRQRHDELPKLVEICGRFMASEQEVLDRVLAARTALYGARHGADLDPLGRAEAELRGALRQLFTRARSYPEVGANPAFAALRDRASELEAGISERFGRYNAAVHANNEAIEQFPGNVVAVIGGFKPFAPLPLEAITAAPAP